MEVVIGAPITTQEHVSDWTSYFYFKMMAILILKAVEGRGFIYTALFFTFSWIWPSRPDHSC